MAAAGLFLLVSNLECQGVYPPVLCFRPSREVAAQHLSLLYLTFGSVSLPNSNLASAKYFLALLVR